MRAAILITLGSPGCSEPEAPLPTIETPVDAIRWPTSPEGLPAEVARCVTEYRDLAREGLPERAEPLPPCPPIQREAEE